MWGPTAKCKHIFGIYYIKTENPISRVYWGNVTTSNQLYERDDIPADAPKIRVEIGFLPRVYHDSLYKYGIASNVMLTGLMNDPLSNTKVFCSLYFQLSRASGHTSMHFGLAISSGYLF